MTSEISWLVAFSAGLLSFLSPCVLPIVPSFLCFVTGLSFSELAGPERTARHRRVAVWSALLFVLGFSTVFVALGTTASAVSQLLRGHLWLLNKVGGVLVILFGFYIMGALKLDFLGYEKRFHFRQKPLGLIGSFLVGMAFAAGWTPCVGPILAGILALATQAQSLAQGAMLLGVYSLGLGVPFFLSALMLDSMLHAFDRVKRHYRAITAISGLLLVFVGALLFTDSFARLNSYLPEWGWLKAKL